MALALNNLKRVDMPLNKETINFASRSSCPFFLSSSLQLITYSLVFPPPEPTFMQQKFAYNVGLVSTYSVH